jgi:small-conductance mechanosensitive channel
MWERFFSEMTKETLEILRSVAQFLPRLMITLIIVLIGWVIAYVLRYLLRSILRLAKFDRLSEDAGASQFL